MHRITRPAGAFFPISLDKTMERPVASETSCPPWNLPQADRALIGGAAMAVCRCVPFRVPRSTCIRLAIPVFCQTKRHIYFLYTGFTENG